MDFLRGLAFCGPKVSKMWADWERPAAAAISGRGWGVDGALGRDSQSASSVAWEADAEAWGPARCAESGGTWVDMVRLPAGADFQGLGLVSV
jgi:hypothetical protein